MADSEKTAKKLSKTQILLIAAVAALVVALAAAGIVIWRLAAGGGSPSGTVAPAQFGQGNGVVGDETEGLRERIQSEIDEGMFEVSMNSVWTFPDGTSPSPDAYVANSANNKRPIYFEVVLSGTDETIYTSPKIPVGSAVSGFALEKDLDAGFYEADCVYYLLNSDDTVFSTTSIVVRMTVEG